MASHLHSSLFEQFYPEIVVHYVIDGLSLAQLKEILIKRDPRLLMSDFQWRNKLLEFGISKNNNLPDAEYILENLRENGYEVDQCLVIADGILVDVRDLQRYCKRKGISSTKGELSLRAQQIFFIPLPFTFTILGDLEFLKGFRKLLWYTRLHFDKCFTTGIWSPNNYGIYGRHETLIPGLSDLTTFHNMICDALKHWRNGDCKRFWAEITTTQSLYKSIVQTYHHRQFPDILAISLLFEKHQLSCLRIGMAKGLFAWAKDDAVGLQSYDPRRRIFEEMIHLPMDPHGHLYLAYDAYCRHLWMTRATGNGPIKAYYGYNQASLPRTIPGGFYDLFKAKNSIEIQGILQQVDLMFPVIDHARVCLWQTAIRYLLQEHQYDDAEIFSTILASSLLPDPYPPGLFQERQLNADTSISLFLLGSAQISLKKVPQAQRSFPKCVEIRSVWVSDYSWDPILAGALEQLQNLAERMNNYVAIEECKWRISLMYSAMEQNYLTSSGELVRDVQSR